MKKDNKFGKKSELSAKLAKCGPEVLRLEASKRLHSAFTVGSELVIDGK